MKPTVVFQTDFGFGGGGAMAGVVKSIDSEVGVYDLDHHIAPFNVRAAAYSLSTVTPYWPAGTVFVSVVDPGVGTTRRSAVAKLKNGSYVVTPDNGTLTLIADEVEAVRSIDEAVGRLPGSENVFIFHGRDIYAYTAGKLAAGVLAFEDVGPAYPVSELVLAPLTNVPTAVREGFAQGGIYNFEVSYGCARINIFNRDFQNVCGFAYGDTVRVCITDGERVVFEGDTIYERTFGMAPTGVPLLLGDIQHGDAQKLRFTINDCNFIKLYAPELENNLEKSADYVFTVTKK